MFARTFARTVTSTSRVSLARTLPRFATMAPRISSFHTTPLARGQGESDIELSSRLAQEITYEKEADITSDPPFLSDFKKQGIWKIQDKPGSDECTLTREFGNEHISVLFSIGDIDTKDMSSMEEDEEISPAKNEEDEEEDPGFPVRLAITISKPGKGAMTIDAQAQDGDIIVENISFFKDNKLATELTAEADWARRGLYIGPQFETLDEQVQTHFEKYLTERGIDSNLAMFIPSFAEYKEQKEYCGWLENVKDFVDA